MNLARFPDLGRSLLVSWYLPQPNFSLPKIIHWLTSSNTIKGVSSLWNKYDRCQPPNGNGHPGIWTQVLKHRCAYLNDQL
ncbi:MULTISPECIES: hypothetical protein [unclassified Nostoc]|uniref:hypothetical protein n=1 Tax=unclassified Nostoc TaxID=2593658 RepID=UPI000A8B3D4E|nr:hypothetical protein [Nostoc sp. KVJ20]